MTASIRAGRSIGQPGRGAAARMAFLIVLSGLPAAETVAEAEHGFETETLGLFLGAARNHRDDGLAIGLEYEYRFTARFGLGALAEYTSGELDTWVFAVPLAYHRGPWKLYAGPGVERRSGSTESMVRFGAEYGFHFENWEVSPQVDYDMAGDERVFVIGVTFARGF